MRRALLSVSDKTGLEAFARGAGRLGFELLSSGGTAALLAEDGIPVTPLEEVTGFAEMLGHRVKTLHPTVHGGILARRDVPEDVADLATHGIEPIDLVCVNLYPFEQTVGRLDVEWDELIEQIDIGGPALLRAAAKNHAHVIPVCRPQDYDRGAARAARADDVSAETRRTLAGGVFTPHRRATTAPSPAGCCAARAFPETLLLGFDHALDLPTARTRTSGRPTTPSAAPGRTCSRASSSSTASRSRSTTSTTSTPPGCSRSSSSCRPA